MLSLAVETCSRHSCRGAVRGIGFSPDGSMIASRSEDSSVILVRALDMRW